MKLGKGAPSLLVVARPRSYLLSNDWMERMNCEMERWTRSSVMAGSPKTPVNRTLYSVMADSLVMRSVKFWSPFVPLNPISIWSLMGCVVWSSRVTARSSQKNLVSLENLALMRRMEWRPVEPLTPMLARLGSLKACCC